ncbi:MAG: 3-oxoacyl-ACP reductase family protein [Dehalococcoidia bacterium]
MNGLSGKVALVTGGGRGIGRAITQRLASEGATVAVSDIDEASAKVTAEEVGGGAVGIHIDVADRASVRAGVAAAEQALGPLDVLVNNAGWERVSPFLDSDEEDWARIVAINFIGPLNCFKAVLPGMVERGQGRIVSISSDAGRAGSSGEAVYSGAKAGIIGFSKTIAREMARYGINVNVVCPGPTATQMFDEVTADRPNLREALVRAIPLRRPADPDEIAAAVAFLASDDARYMTGQTLSVSGGLTMI